MLQGLSLSVKYVNLLELADTLLTDTGVLNVKKYRSFQFA